MCPATAGLEKRRTAKSSGFHGAGAHGVVAVVIHGAEDVRFAFCRGLIWSLLVRDRVSWLPGDVGSCGAAVDEAGVGSDDDDDHFGRMKSVLLGRRLKDMAEGRRTGPSRTGPWRAGRGRRAGSGPCGPVT